MCSNVGTFNSSDGLIEYVRLTQNKVEEALDLLHNSFFKEESLSVAVNLHKHPEAIREFDQLTLNALKDGVSLGAIEKTTGKLVGCLICKIVVKGVAPSGYFEGFNLKDTFAKAYLAINSEIDSSVDIFDVLKTDCYLETVMGVVSPEFRKMGIFRKFLELALEIIQEFKAGKNVKVDLNGEYLPLHTIPTEIIGVCTSPATRKVSEDLGYIQISEIDFQERKSLHHLIKNPILPVPIMYRPM